MLHVCFLKVRSALTLPDPSTVDVNLHGVGGVVRLVIVEDEDVTSEGVDTGRVHRCILGKEGDDSYFQLTKWTKQTQSNIKICSPASSSISVRTCTESSRTWSLLSAP